MTVTSIRTLQQQIFPKTRTRHTQNSWHILGYKLCHSKHQYITTDTLFWFNNLFFWANRLLNGHMCLVKQLWQVCKIRTNQYNWHLFSQKVFNSKAEQLTPFYEQIRTTDPLLDNFLWQNQYNWHLLGQLFMRKSVQLTPFGTTFYEEISTTDPFRTTVYEQIRTTDPLLDNFLWANQDNWPPFGQLFMTKSVQLTPFWTTFYEEISTTDTFWNNFLWENQYNWHLLGTTFDEQISTTDTFWDNFLLRPL